MAHHDHDNADDSVVYLDDGSDDDRGAPKGADKVSTLEVPVLLPSPLTILPAPVRTRAGDAASVAFVSLAGAPLYRPPR